MRTVRTVVVLALALLIAYPLLAGEAEKKGKGEKKPPACPAAQRVEGIVKTLTLTDEQNTKLDAIKKEFGPKLMEAMKKVADILTPEQKKARAEATKKAQEAGKKGKDLWQAVDAAVVLTDEQKPKMSEAKKEVDSLGKELHDKVMSVLTEEQRAKLKKPQEGKKPKGEGKKAEK